MLAERVTAVVLCGGGSRRLGGRDKTCQSLAGTTVLDYLLDRLPAFWQVMCVGEKRATSRVVGWTRESPPGGGPVAGLAAGLAAMPATGSPVCVVVGGDMPFAADALTTLAATLDARPGVDAVVGAGPQGRVQPLLAAYRTDALRRALPLDPAGARLMGLLEGLRYETSAFDERASFDVDTPEALDLARRMVGP